LTAASTPTLAGFAPLAPETMKLEFHREAEMELIEAGAHHEFQVPGPGERFEADVRRATDILLEQSRCRLSGGSRLRRLGLDRFAFTQHSSARSGLLRIEVVAHQSRRPGCWRSRLER
jgi:hypothetical protein